MKFDILDAFFEGGARFRAEDESLEHADTVVILDHPRQSAPLAELKPKLAAVSEMLADPDRIAVIYLSDLTLVSEGLPEDIVGELDLLIHSKTYINAYLRFRLAQKLKAVVEKSNVVKIVFFYELVERYFNDFLRNGDPVVAEELERRVGEGSLRIFCLPYTPERAAAIRNL